MTQQDLTKMEELKKELKIVADEIKLGQLNRRPVAKLQQKFFELSRPYKKLWIKKFNEENKPAGVQIKYRNN